MHCTAEELDFVETAVNPAAQLRQASEFAWTVHPTEQYAWQPVENAQIPAGVRLVLGAQVQLTANVSNVETTFGCETQSTQAAGSFLAMQPEEPQSGWQPTVNMGRQALPL